MEIREVHEGMAGAVKAFLADRENFRDATGWEGLFNYKWKPEGLPYGYAIFNQEKMVGFLGTIFAERIIDGNKRLCCNTSSWFVEEEFRSQMQALRLFAPILKMKDLLITNMTPADDATKICERLGYQYLDYEQVVVPVLPLPAIRRRFLVTFDSIEIAGHLSPAHRQILQDHSGLACRHFLIKEHRSGRYCYGIATTTPVRKFQWLQAQWFNLCYLSDAKVFVESYGHLRWHLWRAGRFVLVRYDSRLLPSKISRFSTRKKKARQYKSEQPLLCTIDNIYSELVTFNKY